MDPQNPLIVQSNSTLLLEVNSPKFRSARDAISAFAHLEKSPEYIHTYAITPLSLWNAASLGLKADEIITRLDEFSKYPLPGNVIEDIRELVGRFGAFVLEKGNGDPILTCREPGLLETLLTHPKVSHLVGERKGAKGVTVPAINRGVIKQIFISLGFPIHDKAGYTEGERYSISLKSATLENLPFTIREYQKLAAEAFVGNAQMPGGSGVVVLPCGAGKTIVGMVAMSLLQTKTLVLVTSVTAARQWKREFIDKTSIPASDIGEYSGEAKEIRPITLATYQILTYRGNKEGPFVHFGLFNSQNWGLIIYDEVHLLPAPIFKITADLQSRRRLGLTATLIREDGHETDVFTLIGPKKFDMPWKDLERQGWIATAKCVEVRVELPASERLAYFALPPKQQIRLAYENPAKIPVVHNLLKTHANDSVIIIGQYLTQINVFASEFNTPIITGATPNKKRDELYAAFRKGEIKVLTLSKVGNFAVDLPDANVLIQISGSYGSRQEEAQRLGRILRPKKNGEQATFYSIVTRESKELDFAMKRQLFLTEQGYSYEIRNWGENK
jgi:DNA excision repair protein ERCC-3